MSNKDLCYTFNTTAADNAAVGQFVYGTSTLDPVNSYDYLSANGLIRVLYSMGIIDLPLVDRYYAIAHALESKERKKSLLARRLHEQEDQKQSI